MKPGDVVLVRFPQTDLSEGKLRPALVVALAPGRHPDTLLALITSRIYQAIPGFDEIIAAGDGDFAQTGMKTASAVRLTRLATVERTAPDARLGSIGDERLRDIRRRSAHWLAP